MGSFEGIVPVAVALAVVLFLCIRAVQMLRWLAGNPRTVGRAIGSTLRVAIDAGDSVADCATRVAVRRWDRSAEVARLERAKASR